MLVLATLSITRTPTLKASMENDPQVVTLYAGQNIAVGTVSVWGDGTYIHVTYQTTDDWVLTVTHLYVGKTNPSSLTSAPGQFPDSAIHNPPVTSYTYSIACSAIDGYHLKSNNNGHPTGQWLANGNPGITYTDDIYIAGQAEVQHQNQKEGAWGNGINFGNDWAMYFTYEKTWILLDTLVINSQLNDHTDTSNFNSKSGETYLIKANGLYCYYIWDGRVADPEFVWIWDNYPYDGHWAYEHTHFYCINDPSLDFGNAYHDNHTYYAYFTGDGNAITYTIMDANYPQAWYDNVGTLTVEIYGWV